MSWQRISMFTLCLLLLCATACGQGPEDNTDDDPLNESVVINHNVDRTMALRESDAYELETDGDHVPVIEDDTLTLTVSYTGGCETHDFTLITDGNFMESDPVQLIITLTHDDKEDPCEAYPTDRYVFDLTPIKTRYQQSYRTNEGSIILNLWHLGHPGGFPDAGFFTLVYTFAP